MSGAFTEWARFRIEQSRTLAGEAAADVARLKGELARITERFAGCEDGSTWAAVARAKEELEKAEARKLGAETLLARREDELRDPAKRALFERMDELETKVSSTDFAANFEASIGPRIDALVAELAKLIPDVKEAISEAAEPSRQLVEAITTAGLRDKFGNRFELIPLETGYAAVRNRMARAIGEHRVDQDLFRACFGFRP